MQSYPYSLSSAITLIHSHHLIVVPLVVCVEPSSQATTARKSALSYQDLYTEVALGSHEANDLHIIKSN